MKTIKLLNLVILLAFFMACSQSDNAAPEVVKTAFTKKFTNAQKVKWDKENETEWEVEFEQDGKEFSANFSSDGSWIETEYEISATEIPGIVKNTIASDFSEFEINHAEIIENKDGKAYELDLKKGDIKKEVVISNLGEVLKNE